MDFDKIKLIIWDLDETLWEGTLSEEDVHLPENRHEFLSALTDAGIVNSICSKNDEEKALFELEKLGIKDYFVFPSINWLPKGARIQTLISDIQLRPANVLFLDDNPSNLGEALHFCPELMTAEPSVIDELLPKAVAARGKDPDHKRLERYRILEHKQQEKAHYASNEAFLTESNIQVEIHNNCIPEIKRIHELLLRSNQLNFTKIRSSEGELKSLLEKEGVDAAYITVKDRYGDYGIVGFYAVDNGELIHFLFSCRILGMGVEQYIYNSLKRPKLVIAGETVSDLTSEEIPAWINQNKNIEATEKLQIKGLTANKVLIKGPCDLFQVFPYIADTEYFDTEFTYTTKTGNVIESTGHTTHIVEALNLSEEQKRRVIEEVPIADMGIYNDAIFTKGYEVVFISILADANLGVYQRKDTGEKIAAFEYNHPLTDPKNWDKYLNGEFYTAGTVFSQQLLSDFSEKYEFIGRNTPEQTVQNLAYIRQKLHKDCMLVVMLGGELEYKKNTIEAYNDRHLVHKNMNKQIRAWANGKDNVRLLDVNKYLTDQSSFYDHFNHYIKPVYYALAQEMVEIVNERLNSNIRNTSKGKMALIRMKEMLWPAYNEVRKWISTKN